MLVTGGAGFIGSHLVEKLLDLNCDVYVADNLSRGSLENISHLLDGIHFYKVDLTKMKNAISVTRGMDFVFHLAADVGGIHFIKRENVKCLTPDLLIHVNMLEACRINDVERFLFTSSACVYREKNPDELNIFREEDAIPASPSTTYGWAKLMGEIQLIAFIKQKVLKIMNWRPKRVIFDPSKPVGVLNRALDIKRAKELLGWKPRFSLEEGLRKTIEWYVKTHKRKDYVDKRI